MTNFLVNIYIYTNPIIVKVLNKKARAKLLADA
jgi:hypothetical protein